MVEANIELCQSMKLVGQLDDDSGKYWGLDIYKGIFIISYILWFLCLNLDVQVL